MRTFHSLSQIERKGGAERGIGQIKSVMGIADGVLLGLEQRVKVPEGTLDKGVTW